MRDGTKALVLGVGLSAFLAWVAAKIGAQAARGDTDAQRYARSVGYPDPGADPEPLPVEDPPNYVVRVLDAEGNPALEEGEPIGDMVVPFPLQKKEGAEQVTRLVQSGICESGFAIDVPNAYGYAWMQRPDGSWQFLAAGHCGQSRIKESKRNE